MGDLIEKKKDRGLASEFFCAVVPSVLSFVVSGLYVFVDAYFVGNGVGDQGLAAINIGFTAIVVMQAAGSALGIGTGVHFTFAKADGRDDLAHDCMVAAYISSIVSSLLISIPFIAVPYQMLLVLGASENIAQLGEVYMRTMGYGTLFYVVSTALVPIIRNNGGHVASMLAVFLGCGLNIFLDWLFVSVMGLGLAGAAQASVLGMLAMFICCAVWLATKGKISFRFGTKEWPRLLKKILATGVSPFGLLVAPNIGIIFINKACLAYGGDEALGVFGCMSYLVYVTEIFFQGVGEGAQPILSRCKGEHDEPGLRNAKVLTWTCISVTCVLSSIVMMLLRDFFGPFMGCSPKASAEMSRIMPIFLIYSACVGISHTKSDILYSVGSNARSYIVTYSEPVMILIAILILPMCFGLEGVWWACVAGMAGTALLASFL